MVKDYDYKIIKKYYGEKFAQWCRSEFPTILNMDDGVLSEHIMSLFAPNKSLYDDLYNYDREDDAKAYIYGMFFRYKMPRELNEEEHPAVLMKKAGYTLYECQTVEDVERFKPYYLPQEKLCTFSDIEGRLDRCHVFFAVKDNVDTINRKDFKTPRRQDEYGTSVISLQFTKGEFNDVSIKNRYNHTVENPDATFSNELDNIIPGLTDSFAQHYGFQFTPPYKNFRVPGYVVSNDGKMYKYNLEYEGTYFCADNVVVRNGIAAQIDKYSNILVGNYIFDLQNKKIIKASVNVSDENDLPSLEIDGITDDAFIESIGEIAKIEVPKGELPGSRIIKITNEEGKEVQITIDKNNDMIAVVNNNVKEVGDDFLFSFRNVQQIQMDKLEEVGDNFAFSTKKMKNVNFPNLKHCGGSFLYMDSGILTFNAPNLISVGNGFCFHDGMLRKLYLPKLEKCGDRFFGSNKRISDADFSNLKKCGNRFLESNEDLSIFTANKLEECGNFFLARNKKLKTLRVPRLKKCGPYFCCFNTEMEKCQMDKLESYDRYFFNENPDMRKKIFEQCAGTLINKDENKGFIVASRNLE